MPRTRLLRTITWGLAAVFVLPGCATTSSSPESTTSTSTSSNEASRSPPSRVELASLLTRSVGEQLPPGCRTGWNVSDESGEARSLFCLEFRAERSELGVVPVELQVSNDRVIRVSVTQSFGSVTSAERQFDATTGGFLETCRRRTGGFRYLVVDCEDYVVEIGWNHQYDRARLEMTYVDTYDQLSSSNR